MAGDIAPSVDLQKITLNLARGFETLLQEVKDLAEREATLRKQFDAANIQVCEILLNQHPACLHDEKTLLALDQELQLYVGSSDERPLHVLPDLHFIVSMWNNCRS